MGEWTYCHKCYAPAGAKIGLPDPDQMVIVSYIDRHGSQYVGMGEYLEEDILLTRHDADIMPEEGKYFCSRSFVIYGEDETAAIPFNEAHVFYEQHERCRYFNYIGYAWQPVDKPAMTSLYGFPEY